MGQVSYDWLIKIILIFDWSGDNGLIQPCSLTIDLDNRIYVMDTGNNRIKVLNTKFEMLGHVKCSQLEGRSVTGMCLGHNKVDKPNIVHHTLPCRLGHTCNSKLEKKDGVRDDSWWSASCILHSQG